MWYAIYNCANGTLISIATVVADPLPEGLCLLEIGPTRPADNMMWDPATRTFQLRPVSVLVDRVQDVLTNPAWADFQAVYAGAKTAEKAGLVASVTRLLGGRRYRDESETIEIDPVGS